jgi:lipopolysaccharide/colanic/teichoic acid biosynthesis glycosyltransferase
LTLVASLGAALLYEDGPLPFVAVTAWLWLVYAPLYSLRGPVQRRLQPLGRATCIALALVAATAGLAGVDGGLRGSVVSVLAALMVAGTVRLTGRWLAGPLRVLLVGGTATLDRQLFARGTNPRVHVVGLVPVDASSGLHRSSPGAQAGELERCGWPEELPAVAKSLGAELVALFPGDGIASSEVRRASWALERSGPDLVVVGPFEGIDPHRLEPRRVGGHVGYAVGPPRRPALVSMLRHAVDRFLAGLLLLVLAPLLGVLALAVRLESTGSPFYSQTRIGYQGKPFRMHKLRTMVAGADQLRVTLERVNEADGHFFKIRRDPRLTRLGSLLRKTSLDELPQLLNVLRGEMSLIGPRPLLPAEAAAMDALARRRLGVRPGMTGLWQVSGRSDLGWAESMRLDSHYADNWTLATDLQIAARTVIAVVSGRGAC